MFYIHKINLNVQVYVKLTEKGKEILSSKEFVSHFTPDHEGYYKFQLWELMQIFGKDLWNGCKVPFENNEIVFSK